REPTWLMQTLDRVSTRAKLRRPTATPIKTLSQMIRRHGNEILTFARIITPRPIFAPNDRNSSTRRSDGHGNEFWKKRQRTNIHNASFQRGAPRSKSELS